MVLAFMELQSWREEDGGRYVGWQKSPVRDVQRPCGRRGPLEGPSKKGKKLGVTREQKARGSIDPAR